MTARSSSRIGLTGRLAGRAPVVALLAVAAGLTSAPAATASPMRLRARLRQAQLAIAGEPEVGNVVPDAGPLEGGTAVVVGGSHFTGATEVRFGATPAAGFVVKNDDRIEAVSPAGSQGRVDVTVTTPEGTSAVNKGDHFTYVPPGPYVTEVRPEEGNVEGGKPVKVLGTGFTGATEVTFGGVPAKFEVSSSEAISVSTPVGNAHVVDVRVTTPEGTSPVVPEDHYLYNNPYIEISGVKPSTGGAAGGIPVAISGLGFYGVTGIDFGGVPSESFTVNSPYSITAIVPPHTVGRNRITVLTGFGPSLPEYCPKNKEKRNTNCTQRDFYRYKAPSVDSISPSHGPRSGGTPITITGHGFAAGEGTTEVLFGKALAKSVNCSSESECTALTPGSNKAGSAYVKVTVTTNITGRSKKNPAVKFEYE
ncbi:MAG TPA: IPT/TIG domain-containing protein [Solirubrobacteraceae bacterium]|nr:IPT/TIG domain-containing protein [Solirubrobacteraceae bacterium]